jgi:hypothetical protein
VDRLRPVAANVLASDQRPGGSDRPCGRATVLILALLAVATPRRPIRHHSATSISLRPGVDGARGAAIDLAHELVSHRRMSWATGVSTRTGSAGAPSASD